MGPKVVTSGGRICDAIFVAYTDVNEYLGHTRRPDDNEEVRLRQGILDAGAPAWVSTAPVGGDPDGFYFLRVQDALREVVPPQ